MAFPSASKMDLADIVNDLCCYCGEGNRVSTAEEKREMRCGNKTMDLFRLRRRGEDV